MRKANIQRKTAETDISLALNLDGCGITDIETIGIETPEDLEKAEAFLKLRIKN